MRYTYRVYEDNAGHYHLFAVTEDGIPVAGFSTPDFHDIIYAVKHTVDPVTEWEGQFGCDDDIDADFDSYMTAKKQHIREAVKEVYDSIDSMMEQRNGGAWEVELYRVLPEYHDLWTDETDECIVTKDEIERLTAEWDKTVEELMDQVEEL